MNESVRLWGARFRSPPSPELVRLSGSPLNHFRLVPEDLRSSTAHARELERAGILDKAEAEKITTTLQSIGEDWLAGRLVPSENDEDVHTFLERELTSRLGALGGKLRAGRSRNDQAANNLKLYLRRIAHTLVANIVALQEALIAQAKEHQQTLAPGFTHLQPAQPVTFGHQLLAHAQGFSRDIDRIIDWHKRAGRSPLGAAALAGSAIALNPELSASELGYDAPCENSIDAVGSRDHVAEFLFIAAMLGVNLSRLSEEVFLWSSKQFHWVELDDGYATGSSIMPQKKNADIAELTRGRSARLIASLNGMLIALKGLPFAYNRDLSEDKWTSFEAVDTLDLVLPAMAGMIATMKVDKKRLRAQSFEGFTLATEVADWLSQQGIPFSEAHEITGALVRYCEEKAIGLEDLSVENLSDVDARLKADVLTRLSPEAAIAARKGYGGTAPDRVGEQIDRLQRLVQTHRQWAKLS
ncbi:argininosuccinate lyase [Brucella sp. BE17]|uniref:argininosuccinate lyase n=1 Tax=Brucella sp. BE17 TaxID=3142977 RepID=UPI0031BAD25D